MIVTSPFFCVCAIIVILLVVWILIFQPLSVVITSLCNLLYLFVVEKSRHIEPKIELALRFYSSIEFTFELEVTVHALIKSMQLED